MGARAGPRRDRRPKKRQDGVVADLVDYARHQFALDIPGAGGATRRDDLLSALRQARKGWTGAPKVADVEADLDGPGCPFAGEHLWEWFFDLHRARGSTGFGPAAIGWQDVAAWARLTMRDPRPWECAALMALDRAYREEWAKLQPKAEKPG